MNLKRITKNTLLRDLNRKHTLTGFWKKCAIRKGYLKRMLGSFCFVILNMYLNHRLSKNDL